MNIMYKEDKEIMYIKPTDCEKAMNHLACVVTKIKILLMEQI